MAFGFVRMPDKKALKTATTRKVCNGIGLAMVSDTHDLLLVSVKPSPGLKDLPPPQTWRGLTFV
jgi:hypothetical protein